MRILLVLNELTIPGKGERKEGLYPTLIKMHSTLTAEVSILAGNVKRLEKEQLTTVGEMTKGIEIIMVCGWHLFSLVSYIIRLPFNQNFLTWARYSYVYRSELLAVDKYIKKTELPTVLTALQSCEYSGILAYIISRKHSVPYIIMEHRTHYQRGLMIGKRGRVVKDVIKSADLVLTVSSHLANNIQRALGITSTNFKTMPNPIPDDFFVRPSNSFAKVREFANGRFVFGGWTNWRDIKRLDLAIEAFQLVQQRLSDTCLVIAGPVPDWAQSRINEMELSASILLLGSIDREKIKLLAYESDCCIIPSDCETFGLPAIETLAAGKPVIVTKCGGPESIITDSRFGRLVDVGDVHGFAEAMVDVVNTQTTFKPVEISAYCRDTFGEKVLTKKWQKIYSSLSDRYNYD